MTIDDVITMLNSEDCMLAIAGMCLMRYKKRDCWKCILKQYSKTVYNKALDDFVNVCEKQFTIMYGQRYVDMRDIKIIAEQLKAVD